jgi:hypothetical protein
MEVKQYLEYLDKEMTIMGILSAVSIGAPAAILNFALSKDAQRLLWNPAHFFLVVGSTLCVLAALLFYKQRSVLAWYYGQMCLAEALSTQKSATLTLREWLLDADSWETWWPYCCGFTFLIAGFSEFVSALFLLLVPQHWSWLSAHLFAAKLIICLVPVVAAALIAPLQWYVRTTYKFSDSAWSDFRADLFRRLRRERDLPHAGVYARLQPSRIHGIGVFAIAEVPMGTYVFEPDDGATVFVLASKTEDLPTQIRKLYRDFCVLKDGQYECPSNFNQLTASWYINHSEAPNVGADQSLHFYALRDIEPGEELTANYHSYSETNLE